MVEVINPLGQTVTFRYDEQHNIQEIIDPRGVAVARNEYDEEGRLLATIDAKGNRTEYRHDIEGRQEIIKDVLGNVTLLVYDEKGNILQKTDPNGLVTENSYDENGNLLTQVTSGDGIETQTVRYTYNIDNLVDSVTAENGNRVSIEYDQRSNVLSMKDIEKNIINYTYDNNGNLTSQLDANGNEIAYAYSESGQITQITKRSGITGKIGTPIIINYDNEGKITDTRNEEGIVTRFQYDEKGNCSSRTIEDDGTLGSQTVTTNYQYDDLGNIKQIIDPKGNVTLADYNEINKISTLTYVTSEGNKQVDFTYDDVGNFCRVDYPDHTSESFEYDAKCRVVKATDRNGITLQYTYDCMDNILSITYPNGGCVQNSYDLRGLLTQVKDVKGGTTSYGYDSNNKNTSITDAYGNKITFSYNKLGYLESRTDAKGNTYKYEYDANGNQTKVIYPKGVYDEEKYTEVAYDNDGNVTAIRNLDGATQEYTYDEIGRLVNVVDAEGSKWEYTYDNLSNLTSITDPNGHITRYTYDENCNLITTELPLGMMSCNQYNELGQVVATTDFNGNETTFIYDQAGNIEETRYADGSVQHYTFNSNGQLEKVTDRDQVVEYTYNSVGQIITKKQSDGITFNYSYDKAGNIISVKTPYTNTEYQYDLLNRLINVNEDGKNTTYSYDANGNVEEMTYPNGCKTVYQYDNWNRLIQEVIVDSKGNEIEHYEYELAPAGNRVCIIETDGTVIKYDYDKVYKLTKEERITPEGKNDITTYTYDEAGNRIAKVENEKVTNYTYDENNRLLTANGTAYTYDNNGNLLSQTDSEKKTTYTYDERNRLIKAKVQSGNEICIEEYEYDWEGNRITKTVNEVNITKYIVDSNRTYAQVLAELDGENKVKVKYVYGHSIISQTRDENVAYYGFDGLGNVRLLTNEDGSVTDTYTYDAFGNLLKQTGNTENNYLYCGEQYDANTGFYYLRARYMDPTTGRFITMDEYSGSIFDPASLHKYLYVNSNPINAKDPSGYFSLAETSICQTIQGYLDDAAVALAQYKTIMNNVNIACTLYDIGNTFYSAILAGGSPQEVAMSIARGLITSVAINNICKCSMFGRIAVGVFGTALDIDGIKEAFEQKRYDLVLTRSVQFTITILQVVMGRCFTGDTLIATADGEKPIAEIEVGDYVWAEDVETGEKALKQVEEVFVKETSTLVHVTVRDQVINTTETHLFYVKGKGWIEAIDLEEGDQLSLLDGTTACVEKVEKEYLDEPVKVYNFTVQDWHNYYVSKLDVLVHNAANYTKDATPYQNTTPKNKQPINSEIGKLKGGNGSNIARNYENGNQVMFGGHLGKHRERFVPELVNALEWYVQGPAYETRLLQLTNGEWAYTTDHYITAFKFAKEVSTLLTSLTQNLP